MGEKEMSMSIQSAWEDLVVENPNRKKLEGCLLGTIMLVVICIIALILFVFVTLQPADNIVKARRRVAVNYCGNASCTAYVSRLLGWLNWTSIPCKGVSDWACGGRSHESSDPYVHTTAAEAASDYAAEHFIELLDRTRGLMTEAPYANHTNSTLNEGTAKRLLEFMTYCLKGYNSTKTFLADLRSIIMGPTQNVKGNIQDSQATLFTNEYLLQLATLMNFFPYGKVSSVNERDLPERKYPDDFAIVYPMKFLGTVDDFKSVKFRTAYETAFTSLAEAFELSLTASGHAVFQFEQSLVEAKAKVHDPFMSEIRGGWPEPFKPAKGDTVFKMVDYLQHALNLVGPPQHLVFVDPRDRGVHAVLTKSTTKEVANYATFKLFMHLLPLIPDEANLKKFREFGSRAYFRRLEPPNRVTHCVKMADDLMPHDVLSVIAQEDKLRTTTVMTIMNDTLGKLFADFAAPGAPAKPGKKKTIKSTILSDAVLDKGSVFGDKNTKYLGNTMEFVRSSLEQIRWFYPTNMDVIIKKLAAVPFVAEASLMGSIKQSVTALKNSRGHSQLVWSEEGSLSAKPYYDPIADLIYVPFGFSMIPFFHKDNDDLLSHSTPSFTTGLIKACLERFLTYAYKDKTYRTPPPPPILSRTFVIATKEAGDEIKKRVQCFQKLPNVRDKALSMFLTRSAMYLTYKVWRHGKNHATFDLSYQIRLAGLPFFSEEAIFYASAAQGICEAANPEVAPKYLIDHSKAVVDMAFHGNHFGMTMHCHKKRPAYSPPSCKHMFRELELSGENLKSDRGPRFS